MENRLVEVLTQLLPQVVSGALPQIISDVLAKERAAVNLADVSFERSPALGNSSSLGGASSASSQTPADQAPQNVAASAGPPATVVSVSNASDIPKIVCEVITDGKRLTALQKTLANFHSQGNNGHWKKFFQREVIASVRAFMESLVEGNTKTGKVLAAAMSTFDTWTNDEWFRYYRLSYSITWLEAHNIMI